MDCLTRPKSFENTEMNPELLIDILNQRQAMSKIQFLKKHKDTVFIKIENGAYLSQQMGTTGAWNWLAETTFTLTELKGIENVNMEFEEGDHARPGNYTRERFKYILLNIGK